LETSWVQPENRSRVEEVGMRSRWQRGWGENKRNGFKGEGKAIPLQALRVPEVWGSQILRHLGHEGGKVVSHTNRPPVPPGNSPGTHFY
jgi:hypothetical protein